MKITMNVECSPQEARAFLGLPDLAPINALLVGKVTERIESNFDMMNPAELVTGWMSLGGKLQEQFLTAMTAAADASLRTEAEPKSGDETSRGDKPSGSKKS